MTYSEAKLYMLCVCYTLRELKDKRGALLAGEAPPVPSRLIDTAGLDEVEEAIREYDGERFWRERDSMSALEAHPVLIREHLGPDRDLGKALERGIRGLCVREGRDRLRKLLEAVGIDNEADCLAFRLCGEDDEAFRRRREDVLARQAAIREQVKGGYPWYAARHAKRRELEAAIALYDDELYRHLRGLVEKVRLEDASMVSHDDFLYGERQEEYGWPRYAFLRERYRSEPVRFGDCTQFYFITGRSGTGTLISGLAAPEVMVPLLGMVCLEELDPRRVAEFFVKEFHFNIVAEDEPEENVAFAQFMFRGLTALISDFSYGDAHGIFRADVFEARDRFSGSDMEDAVRSIDWKKCSETLFS